MDGKEWPTTEHYFQAQKFAGHASLQEQIRTARSAREAFNIARNPAHASLIRSDWATARLNVMLKALRAKFTQHEDLKRLLKNTDTRILVENAGANDAFWGAGVDGNEGNHLGELLMQVRAELS